MTPLTARCRAAQSKPPSSPTATSFVSPPHPFCVCLSVQQSEEGFQQTTQKEQGLWKADRPTISLFRGRPLTLQPTTRPNRARYIAVRPSLHWRGRTDTVNSKIGGLHIFKFGGALDWKWQCSRSASCASYAVTGSFALSAFPRYHFTRWPSNSTQLNQPNPTQPTATQPPSFTPCPNQLDDCLILV